MVMMLPLIIWIRVKIIILLGLEDRPPVDIIVAHNPLIGTAITAALGIMIRGVPIPGTDTMMPPGKIHIVEILTPEEIAPPPIGVDVPIIELRVIEIINIIALTLLMILITNPGTEAPLPAVPLAPRVDSSGTAPITKITIIKVIDLLLDLEILTGMIGAVPPPAAPREVAGTFVMENAITTKLNPVCKK